MENLTVTSTTVFDGQYKNMSNSSPSPNPTCPVQFHTIYSTHIICRPVRDYCFNSLRWENVREGNKNMWLRGCTVLEDIYIITFPFWDENKIRNKFTEPSGDIEQRVSGYNKTSAAWFLYTTSLYTQSWSPVNQSDNCPPFKTISSPFSYL